MDRAQRELMGRIGEHERFGLHNAQRNRLMQILHNQIELNSIERRIGQRRESRLPNVEQHRTNLLKVLRNTKKLWALPTPARTKAGERWNRINRWPRVLGWLPFTNRSYSRILPPENRFHVGFGGWGRLNEFERKLQNKFSSPEPTREQFDHFTLGHGVTETALGVLQKRVLGRKFGLWDRIASSEVRRLTHLIKKAHQ